MHVVGQAAVCIQTLQFVLELACMHAWKNALMDGKKDGWINR